MASFSCESPNQYTDKYHIPIPIHDFSPTMSFCKLILIKKALHNTRNWSDYYPDKTI